MTLNLARSLSSLRSELSRTSRLFLMALFVWSSGCQSMHLATHSFELPPERHELILAARTYREILDTQPKSQNAHLTQLLERVGQRIADVAERPDFDWEFTLLSGPSQNAFCLPGGKVGVYEGILPVCQNEAGLAVVLSHEIAHALARHGGERLSQRMSNEPDHWSFARMVGIADSQQIDMVKSVYGLESKKGVPLPYSRTQEAEADSIGLLLMARAGYDPNEAPLFWERSSRMTGEKTPELLATHPSDDIRAAKLKEIVPRALSVYQGAPQRYRQGEQIPMEALAELIKKPTPKAPEAEKTTAATTPPTTPAPVAAAATPATPPAPAATTTTAAATTPAETPPVATAAATPAPAAPPAEATITTAAATVAETNSAEIITALAVTPAPVVHGSSGAMTTRPLSGVTALLPNLGDPTVEGSAADASAAAQAGSVDQTAAPPQESGGWKPSRN